MHEHATYRRSLVKATTWRIIATTTTMVLVFIFTGHLILSLGIGAGDIIVKFILYFLHERAWDHIFWGKIVTEDY